MTEPLNNHSNRICHSEGRLQPALKSHEEVGALIGKERLEALVKQLTDAANIPVYLVNRSARTGRMD